MQKNDFTISVAFYQKSKIINFSNLFTDIASYYNLLNIFRFILDYLESLKVRKSHLSS